MLLQTVCLTSDSGAGSVSCFRVERATLALVFLGGLPPVLLARLCLLAAQPGSFLSVGFMGPACVELQRLS